MPISAPVKMRPHLAAAGHGETDRDQKWKIEDGKKWQASGSHACRKIAVTE